MNHIYSVPLIPQNLSKHETIVQIAEVLDHISNITDDIFKRINTRLETNNRILTNISGRVDLVNTKISKLKGAKKATQIFSSSKYPASEVNRQYESIFNDASSVQLVRHKVKHKNFVSTYEPLDKLQVYHVKVTNNDDREQLFGLGDIPLDIECVNDLLLYNSGKNLYRDFVISDSLKVPEHVKEDESNNVSDIGAPPLSISERSTLTKTSMQNFFYSPTIGELPALDVPLDLPDLPGIADDVRYLNDLGPAIAPSALTTPNIAEPPLMTKLTDSQVDISTQQNDDIPDISMLPQIPGSRKEQPMITTIIPNKVEEPEPHEEKVVDEIQLPKPQLPKNVKEPVVKQENKQTQNLPQPTDARANLMEAIRQAGGSKKLRTTEPKETKSTSKPPSGDLMADLHAKLSMRRKGISGTKKTENENLFDANSTLGKISAMIPPPEKPEFTDSITEDEDWD